MAISEQFERHFATGVTTVARCWIMTRKDGEVYGFTDHDRDLMVGTVLCKADTGLTAHALEQTTGLSVDNTEALGMLSDASITEKDIRAGRFDGALVEAWLVNWETPSQTYLQFRGSVGELTREAGGFRAELVGQTEKLNTAQGRVYQKPCGAILGDARCRVDMSDPSHFAETVAVENKNEIEFIFDGLSGFADGWFERGRLCVKTGEGAGLTGVIRKDTPLPNGTRKIELWEAIRADMQLVDVVRLEVGCGKRADECRNKFDNFLNFQGFPNIPGEDWLMSYPIAFEQNDGSSLKADTTITDAIANGSSS